MAGSNIEDMGDAPVTRVRSLFEPRSDGLGGIPDPLPWLKAQRSAPGFSKKMAASFNKMDGPLDSFLRKINYLRRIVPCGTEIFKQNDCGDHIYLLTDGWVGLQSWGHDGEEHILDFLIGYGFFGFPCKKTGEYCYSAIAITAVEVYRFEVAQLKTMITGEPSLSVAIQSDIFDQLMRAQSRQSAMACKHGIDLVASALWDLADRVLVTRKRANGSTRLQLPINQSMFGKYVGVSNVYICKMLTMLNAAGIKVESTNGGIAIADFNVLREFVQRSN